MVKYALDGTLSKGSFNEDPIFNVMVPRECPNVPAELLNPRNTWDDPEDYERKALELTGMFHKNFKAFAPEVTAEVAESGPRSQSSVSR